MKKEIKNKFRDIFNKYDLAGIYFNKRINYDEYDPEIEQLLLRLYKIKNKHDLEKELIKIFEVMFWKGVVKKKQEYTNLAKDTCNFFVKSRLINMKISPSFKMEQMLPTKYLF